MTRGDRANAPRPPLTYRVTRREWLALDVGLGLLGLCWSIFSLQVLDFHYGGPVAVTYALMALGTLPVAFRREWPLPVLAVLTAAISVRIALGQSPVIEDLILAAAIYFVATRFDRGITLRAVTVTGLALVAGLIAGSSPHQFMQPNAMHILLVSASAWFIGDGVRSRRRYLAAIADQAAQREQTDADRRRQAIREERVRIARELHDVVAHSLSVITVQAGVGRRVIEARPEEARRALAAVEVTGRGALDELRKILVLLREDDGDQPSLVPVPGARDLDGLVAQVRAAGVPVELAVSGDPASLPPAIGLSVFRIVQEALTNVVKHAGPARAAVGVVISASGVRITVTDDGHGGSPGDRDRLNGESRHGILGMHERVAAFGGTIVAEPRVEGGFQVTAFLPVSRSDA
jgi:signal transduction histidine kinase